VFVFGVSNIGTYIFIVVVKPEIVSVRVNVYSPAKVPVVGAVKVTDLVSALGVSVAAAGPVTLQANVPLPAVLGALNVVATPAFVVALVIVVPELF